MKKCLKCGYENAESMSFCLECGAPLSSPIIVNLNDPKTQSFQGTPTNFGAKETDTFSNNQTNFTPNFAQTERPAGKNKILLIVGGLASLLILGLGAVGAIVAYNKFYQKKDDIVTIKTSPTPTSSVNVNKSPTPKTSPSPSPDATATPQTAFTPPTEPTKRGTFTIYGNSGWQLSNIDVVKLENFTVSSSGLIDIAGVKAQVTPKGFNDKNSVGRRLYPEYPTGALLFRTHFADGHLGNVLPVSGGAFKNFPDEMERLEFCINDKTPESNGGQFTVTVVMTSVPKAK